MALHTFRTYVAFADGAQYLLLFSLCHGIPWPFQEIKYVSIFLSQVVLSYVLNCTAVRHILYILGYGFAHPFLQKIEVFHVLLNILSQSFGSQSTEN